MDNLLNVLNSAPKTPKKRKPKPDAAAKKNPEPSATSPSPPHVSVKTEHPSPPRSPVHSPSTLDLDSLTVPQPETSLDESLSLPEPKTPSDYVPLSADSPTAVDAKDDVTSYPEPAEINVEPIVEKPPQLKVRYCVYA